MKKSLKKQAVFPVLMLLVVTALALIGSSFAWFAMTNVASVSTFQATIEQGSTGLMISANGDDYVSTVALKDANNASDKSQQLSTSWINPGALHQVSTTDGVNFFEAKIESKDTNGVVSTITSTLDLSHPAANMTPASATLPTWDHDSDAGTAEVERTAHIIVFDLYFLVDVDSDLYLNKNSGVTTYSNGSNVSTAQNAIRVAFLSCGDAATTTAAKALTYTNAPANRVIWRAVDDSSTYAKTYGLMAANATAFNAYQEVSGYAVDNGEITGTSIVPENDLSQLTAIPTGLTAIASLKKGYNKLRVVVWLEGNDPDCVVSIAKGGINVTLNFYAKETA